MTDRTTPSRLQREWVLCDLAAAASRFIPVPLADDLVRGRAVRTAVARTWQAHGRPPAPEVIDTLAGEPGGFWSDALRSAARLPVTVVFYPWRKTVRVLTAVHGVSGDLVGVLLLARSVDRCLAAGWFPASDRPSWRTQAELVRRAHDQAVAGADLRVLRHALGTAVRQVTGLRRQALSFARGAFGRSGPGLTDATGDAAGAELEVGVRTVQGVLARPEIVAVLAALDARFDAALPRPT